jgi:integrase
MDPDPVSGLVEVKKGRPRKLTVSGAVKSDFDAGKKFLEKFGSNDAQEKYVIEMYDQFRENSTPTLSVNDAVIPFIGRMIRDKLKPGTQATYFRHLSKRHRARVFRHAQVALDLAHAQADTRHAVDATAEVIQQAIDIAPPSIKFMLWMLAATAGRCKDIQRLPKKDIGINSEHRFVRVRWRATKNRRKVNKRIIITTRFDWTCIPNASIVNWLDDQTLNGPLVEHLTAGRVNRWLRRHVAPIDGRCLTTYSFRRFSIHRLFEALNGDASEVMKYTGHIDESTLQSFYQSWKGAAP